MRRLVQESVRAARQVILTACITAGVLHTWTPAVMAAPTTPVTTPAHLAGSLVDAHFFSAILGHDAPYRVYLPPDYAGGAQHYPVLYMLHGAGGDYTEWTRDMLPDAVDGLIQRGDVLPMIVVMPDAHGPTFWANWPDTGPRWADYLAFDVVKEVDTQFRTLPAATSRAVGGLSMGGLGALHSALHHPDIFGVVGGHSPSIRPEPDLRVVPMLTGQTFDEYNPIWLVQHRWSPTQRLVMWLDIGLDDGYRGYVERFHQVLMERGIDSSWHEFAGGHEGAYWAAHAPDYLRFYSQALRAEPAPLPTATPVQPAPRPIVPLSPEVAPPVDTTAAPLDDPTTAPDSPA
jgi:enterochelin esterase-like enzyme